MLKNIKLTNEECISTSFGLINKEYNKLAILLYEFERECDATSFIELSDFQENHKSTEHINIDELIDYILTTN